MNKIIVCNFCKGTGICHCDECLSRVGKYGMEPIKCQICWGKKEFDWLDFMCGRVPKQILIFLEITEGEFNVPIM